MLFLCRLLEYYSLAVPPVQPCPDPSANPAYSGSVWKSWLDAGDEHLVEPLCEQHRREYEEYRYVPAKPVLGRGGPGLILIVFFVVIMCLLLFGTCLFCRLYCCTSRRKYQVNMDHE